MFKDIKGYEGLYQVSPYGKVRSLDRIDCAGKQLKGETLKVAICKDGYCSVVLCKNGNPRTFRVHKLVYEAFIPNPENKRTVNHKDGNKTNNHVSNLEWCTHGENAKHAFKIGLRKNQKKLSDKQVSEIKALKGVKSSLELSKIYNVSFQLICAIWKGEKRCNTVTPV